ncbi:hypothetical protein MXD81_02465 [Microbacteriaceae bacterium K1510]|nr:hypothetical protein [Microbacteriaceae bacterium K1510]
MQVVRSSIASAVAGVIALTAINIAPAQAASAKQPQAQSAATLDLSARKRHYHRHYRNDRAALQMFGMVAGTIAGIAAAEESRRYYRRGYGYYGDYGYPPPPSPYYGGYGPYYRPY